MVYDNWGVATPKMSCAVGRGRKGGGESVAASLYLGSSRLCRGRLKRKEGKNREKKETRTGKRFENYQATERKKCAALNTVKKRRGLTALAADTGIRGSNPTLVLLGPFWEGKIRKREGGGFISGSPAGGSDFYHGVYHRRCRGKNPEEQRLPQQTPPGSRVPRDWTDTT